MELVPSVKKRRRLGPFSKRLSFASIDRRTKEGIYATNTWWQQILQFIAPEMMTGVGAGNGSTAPGAGGTVGGPSATTMIPSASASTGASASGGPILSQIVAAARTAGAGDSAITAMLSAVLGEGGTSQAWSAGDHGSSFGPWQLHAGGELDRYLREGGKPGDVAAQARYVLKRLNEIMPGFSTSTDRAAQIQAIKRFENSQRGNATGGAYYGNNWASAARLLTGGGGGAPVGYAPPLGVQYTTDPNRGNVTNNSHVGQVNVSVQDHGYAAGGAVAQAIRNATLVTQANGALSG